MRRFKAKRLIWILGLALKKIVESIFIVIALIYIVFVFDIYINTKKLSKVNPAQYIEAEKISRNPKFTKGPVVFRVDKGTLFFRMELFVSGTGLFGYAPFFIFPHHRTVILEEKVLKMGNIVFKTVIAHELGHIQGGLEHFGPAKEMEKYASDFATEIVKTQP